MKAILTKDKFKVYVSFPYDPEVVQEIKEIPMRRFDNVRKSWSVPLEHEHELVQTLTKYGYEIDYQGCQPMPEGVKKAILSVFQNATPEEIINWQAQEVSRLEKKENYDINSLIKSWRVILQAKNTGVI
jgi:hypothetical protein